MLYAFLTSGAILALLGLVKLLESAGYAGVYVRIRERADDALLAGITSLEQRIRSGVDEVRREVVLKGLHIVAYLALIGVRAVEEKLQRLTRFVRGLRRARLPRESGTVLTRMLGEDTHSGDKREQ